MKVSDVKATTGVDRVKAAEAPATTGTGTAGNPQDRVSVDAVREVEGAVVAAKASAGGGRAAQLQRLETQVRSGGYQPDPSRVAEQILADAEIDARLQAMLRR